MFGFLYLTKCIIVLFTAFNKQYETPHVDCCRMVVCKVEYCI